MSVTDKIMKAINRGLEEAAKPKNLRITAQALVQDIKERTKKGKEVKSGLNEGAFKKLKASTIKKRRKAKLSPETTPETSNQIMTGKMVNSLKQTTTRAEIVLTVPKRQQPKLKGNIKLGRNFLKLSKNNLKKIATDIVEFIAKAIERDL